MKTKKVHSFATEFPDFGALPFGIPAGWKDSSYRNDSCPSFRLGEFDEERTPVFQMFVDYADTAMRENGRAARRFTLQSAVVDGEWGVALELEEPRAARLLMALIALRHEARDWQEAMGGEREGLDELCADIDLMLFSVPF